MGRAQRLGRTFGHCHAHGWRGDSPVELQADVRYAGYGSEPPSHPHYRCHPAPGCGLAYQASTRSEQVLALDQVWIEGIFVDLGDNRLVRPGGKTSIKLHTWSQSRTTTPKRTPGIEGCPDASAISLSAPRRPPNSSHPNTTGHQFARGFSPTEGAAQGTSGHLGPGGRDQRGFVAVIMVLELGQARDPGRMAGSETG